MKHIFNTFLCILLFGLFSCEKEKEIVAYYSFTGPNKKEAFYYQVGDTFTLQNQRGDQIYCRVHEEITEIHERTDDIAGFPFSYYWDFRNVWIASSHCKRERCLSFSVQYSRQPIDWRNAQVNKSKTYPSYFVTFLNSNLWNVKRDWLSTEGKIVNRDTSTKTLAGLTRIFHDVFMVESGTNASWDSTGEAPPLVNRIFYSKSTGIVGFDDLSGDQWRLIK